MATIIRFVGINKHQDPLASELSGAVRDATALWALFADSFPSANIHLLTDSTATISEMRRAFLDTLRSAGEEDNVILAFAGHGTADHRLVAHDTSLRDLDGTTIDMSELADTLKASKAKSVLCILDCCFSGKAPARVIEATPTSRAISFPQEPLWGKGKVLIAASNLSGPAYEHPAHRHGLLTYALLQEFCHNTETETDLSMLMAGVMERVRAQASALGVVQTPVGFNFTEGGFKLATPRPGRHYHAAFPEVAGIKVSSAPDDLAQFGIPSEVCQDWKQRFGQGLNPLQLTAINDFRLLDGASLLVVAPTSSGKTFIGEMAGIKAITEGKKAVFLFPFKALVNEKFQDFERAYAGQRGLRVIRCTGDYTDQASQFLRGKFDLAVLTYEMFLSLTLNNPAVLHRIGLIVVDEAQFLADPGRGITVELILTKMRSVRNQGITPQLVLLSATIGDVNHLDEWLEIQALVTNERPVPLEMGVLDRSGTYEYLDPHGQRQIQQLLSPWSVVQRRDKPSSQDVIVPLVQQLLSDPDKQERVLIFRNRRGSARGSTGYLANELRLPPATEALERLPTADPSASTAALRKALEGGVAFHTSDLKPDERLIVEQAFRDPDSPVRVLVATTTVAAGINTPASTVIIVENQFEWEKQDFTVAEMQNMAGRAGRLGYRETGRAILLANTPHERQQLFARYVLGAPEAITSTFHGSDVGTWILRLLAQVGSVPAADLPLLLANTYGGYLISRRNPEWQHRTASEVNELLPSLVEAGILEVDNGVVMLTLLGKECGTSPLALKSVLLLLRLLRRYSGDLGNPMAFMALLQALPELDEQYTPLAKKGQKELVWSQRLAGLVGNPVVTALQHGAIDSFAYAARAKRACIVLDWMNGVPIEHIEATYTTNPFIPVGMGDIVGIANTTRFHLRPAYAIALLAIPQNVPEPTVFDAFLQQLEVGIPARALGLLTLPLRLTRGEYLLLAAHHVCTIEEIAALDLGKLEALLGNPRANEVCAAALVVSH